MTGCFCYLGDKLDTSGGVDAAVRARVRCGWKKFHELVPFLTSRAPTPKMKGLVYSACVRSSMIYGAETWALRIDHERKLETAENRMVSLKDRKSSKELRDNLQIENITEVVRRARIRWFDQVERMEEENWVKRTTRMEVEGRRPAGRPKKTWRETVNADIKQLGIDPEDTNDRDAWKHAISAARSNPGAPGKRTRKR